MLDQDGSSGGGGIRTKTARRIAIVVAATLIPATTAFGIGTPLLHDGRVIAVAFSPMGETVLTGSGDTTARLWDAKTGAPRGEPMRHEADVYAVAFSPDGKTVLTGSWDSTARLWDAENGAPRGQPMKPSGLKTPPQRPKPS